MGDVIVIGGKGGTGKTTISALLVLDLAKKAQGGVLAVDADPNSNLCDALGLKDVGTVADIVDEIAKKPESVPRNMGKDAFVEYRIHTGITESEGFDLLVMGRPEGPGCYCYINNVLRNCMAKLIADYRYIIIDNEAGLEHFSRKTTRACSEMIVVSDATAVGLRSARRIFELADELGIFSQRRFLFVNKVEGPKDAGSMEKDCRLDKVFFIPYDGAVSDLSAKGVSLTCLAQDSAMKQAVVKAGEIIWPKN